MALSLQEVHAPKSICYGCGPTNEKGLRIKSFDKGETVDCEWSPSAHHEAFPGVLNGGVIGSLLDCHCNWTAACKLKEKWKHESMPCTVTAEYRIALPRPTPTNHPIRLVARVEEFVEQNRAWITGELISNGKVTATCRGLFVAVKEGHPAYHRWI